MPDQDLTTLEQSSESAVAQNDAQQETESVSKPEGLKVESDVWGTILSELKQINQNLAKLTQREEKSVEAGPEKAPMDQSLTEPATSVVEPVLKVKTQSPKNMPKRRRRLLRLRK